MQAEPRFSQQTKSFWACVRVISPEVGYTDRKTSMIKVPTLQEMHDAYSGLRLNVSDLGTLSTPSPLARELQEYFAYRADKLNNYVEPRLMDVEAARDLFQSLRSQYRPRCPIPMNK